MRNLSGVLYALGGAVIGLVIGVVAGLLIAKVTNTTNREGAASVTALAVGLVGAVIGLIAGIVLYVRAAPAGQGAASGGAATLGVAALVALGALGAWAWLNLREAPLQYDGAMATLELELRLDTANAPSDSAPPWLDIEVQSGSSRPAGDVRWNRLRTEGAYRIVPVSQNPLMRAADRVVVVRLAGRQTELFVPPMPRTPDSRADWSAWYRPQRVEPITDGASSAAPPSLIELRYRVRRYGE